MFLHLILGLLRDRKQRHGYKLASEYERLSGNPGYPANASRELRKLKDDGLVTRGANAPGEDERRIPYAITDKGCQVFDEWLVSPAAIEEDFSTWILFVDRVPPEICDRLLDQREDELWFLLKSATRAREDALARNGRNGDDHLKTEALHLRRRIMQLSADLEFLRELRKELGSRPQNGGPPDGTEVTR